MTEARIEYAHISAKVAPQYGIEVVNSDDGTGAAVVDIPDSLPDEKLNEFFTAIATEAHESGLTTGIPLIL